MRKPHSFAEYTFMVIVDLEVMLYWSNKMTRLRWCAIMWFPQQRPLLKPWQINIYTLLPSHFHQTIYFNTEKLSLATTELTSGMRIANHDFKGFFRWKKIKRLVQFIIVYSKWTCAHFVVAKHSMKWPSRLRDWNWTYSVCLCQKQTLNCPTSVQRIV